MTLEQKRQTLRDNHTNLLVKLNRLLIDNNLDRSLVDELCDNYHRYGTINYKQGQEDGIKLFKQNETTN